MVHDSTTLTDSDIIWLISYESYDVFWYNPFYRLKYEKFIGQVKFKRENKWNLVLNLMVLKIFSMTWPNKNLVWLLFRDLIEIQEKLEQSNFIRPTDWFGGGHSETWPVHVVGPIRVGSYFEALPNINCHLFSRDFLRENNWFWAYYKFIARNCRTLLKTSQVVNRSALMRAS